MKVKPLAKMKRLIENSKTSSYYQEILSKELLKKGKKELYEKAKSQLDGTWNKKLISVD